MDDDVDLAADGGRSGTSCLDWTAALIRILALWMVATGAIVAASTVAGLGVIANGPFGGMPPARVLYTSGVAAVATFIVAAILWRGASRLADVIWRDQAAAPVTTRFEIHALQRVVRQGVGLYVGVHALAGAPTAVAEYVSSRGASASSMYPDYSAAHLLGVLLQLTIGVMLYFGTARLAGWLDRTRRAR